MGKVSYNIDKLAKTVGINIKKGAENFDSMQEYFDKLNEFVGNSATYLAGYRAEIIASRDSVRKDIIKELHNIRAVLKSLGMAEISLNLKFLENAIFKKDTAALATELTEFYANMEKISEQIDSARLPVFTKPQAAQEPTQQQWPEAAPKLPPKPVVLAVDDKPELLTAIVSVLKNDFNVVGVTSGAAALKAIEKYTPAYFLLDIEMPQMDGYKLAQIIRSHERFHDTPIIFLTGKNSREAVIEAVKHGGNDYLLKPVEKELLLSKIRQYLNKRHLVPK